MGISQSTWALVLVTFIVLNGWQPIRESMMKIIHFVSLSANAVATSEHRLSAILSADVVGYSRLMADDEDATVRTLLNHRSEIIRLVEQHGGRTLDAPGDNLLAEFPTATGAVACAIEVQKTITRNNVRLPESRQMEFRIGIHLGELLLRDEHVFGSGINVAARLEALADPGGVCVSKEVRSQLRGKLAVDFEDGGEEQLKNISEPIHVFRISAQTIAISQSLLDAAIYAGTDAIRTGTGNVPITTRRLKAPLYIAVFVAILAVFLGQMFLFDHDAAQSGPVAEPDTSIDVSAPVPGFSGRAAIAVLPFLNMSNDPEQEYFADGITEDLITGLQSFRSFPIIARTSTFKYKGKSPDIREVAATLGAGYIIEGSVRKVEQDVRINVQLIDSRGQHVWAENYDFKFEEVLRIQADLVSKIMLAIEPELIISEADRTRFVRTEDMEAFDYFLRAATNTNAPFAFTDLNGEVVTPQRLELARDYASKAVDLDPKFAAGWRMLNHIEGSYVLTLAYVLSEEELRATIERGIEYGERSRQLSPFEPSVCSCLAALLLMSGDVEGARLLQEESLKGNPANAVAHAVMAKILQVSGEAERALEEIKIAKRLSPKDMAMSTFLYFEAAIHQNLGHFNEAVALAKEALVFSPLNYDAEYVKITSLYASGRRDLAQAAVANLAANRQSDFRPVSGWDQPFPELVANKVTLASGASLDGLRYNEGLRLVFEDLSWDAE